MISSRFALPVIIVLLFSLVPTVIHSYLGLTEEDGRSVTTISAVLNNAASNPSNRNATWGKDIFDSYDWIERIYKDEHGHNLRLFVARSYDHKRLYHHPELAVSYAKDLGNQRLIHLAGNPPIPVTVLKSPSRPGLAAYVLVYDDKFIDNPITHQLQDSLHLLIGARKPMTLFYVADENAAADVPFEQSPTETLLVSAIKDFLSK